MAYELPQQPPEGLTQNHAHLAINALLMQIMNLSKSQMPYYQIVQYTTQLTQSISSLAQLIQNHNQDPAIEQQKLMMEEYKMERKLEFEKYKLEVEAQIKLRAAELEAAIQQQKLQHNEEQHTTALAGQVQKLEQADENHQQATRHAEEQHQTTIEVQRSQPFETQQPQAKDEQG